MVKVGEINKNNEVSGGKSVRKSSGGESFSSYLSQSMGIKNQQVAGASSISVTDAIFATQMVSNEEEKEIRKKLIKRGAFLIEKLEEIRNALLLGYIDKDELINISRMVKERQVESNDQKLQEILDEIELRVEVELAKLVR